MSVISGQVTFDSAGTKTVYLGFRASEVQIYAGARAGIVEFNGLASVGHGDANNQFSRPTKDGKAEKVQGKCIVVYDGLGNKILEASLVSFGDTTVTFNCTTGSTTYPFDLVARS